MEDALFHLQLKQEREYRMWCEYVEQREAEEKAYNQQAEQYFKDLEQFETIQMDKEYRTINEWEELVTV
jgi:hypothetical protein